MTAELGREHQMKWLSATLAVVLTAVPFIADVSAQTATALTYAQPLSVSGIVAVQQAP